MKEYGYLKAIPLSFYSGKLYRDVGRNWEGAAIVYLIILLVFCALLSTAALQLRLNTNFATEIGPDIDKIMLETPIITLDKDGTITTPENKPYLYHSFKTHEVIGVIDTSGQYTTVDNQSFDFLLTKTTFMERKPNGEIQSKPLPKGYHYVLHPDTARSSIEYWAKRAWILIFPCLLLCGVIWRLIQAAIYAVLGKGIARMMDVKLSYYTIFSLTLVSLTPSIILAVILDAIANIHFRGLGLIYFVLQMIYLSYAIYVNSDAH